MGFLEVVAAVIVIDSEFVLVAKKRETDRCKSVWEFPGGKVEPGERPQDALVREINEELGVTVHTDRLLDSIEVSSTRDDRSSLKVHFFQCHIKEGLPVPLEHEVIGIVRWAELKHLSFHEADQRFVEGELKRRQGI